MFNLLLKKNELIKQKPSNIKTYKMKIKLVKAPKLQNNVGKVHEACYQLIESKFKWADWDHYNAVNDVLSNKNAYDFRVKVL